MPLNFRRSALELYFSSLRQWILLKFGIQHPYAIDNSILKGHQNTLTEWGEINYFVRSSGFFDELKFQHFINFPSLHWILKVFKIQITFICTGCLKKRNLFDLQYLKDGSVKSIVLLVCHSVLPYNSVKHNFGFLWWF